MDITEVILEDHREQWRMFRILDGRVVGTLQHPHNGAYFAEPGLVRCDPSKYVSFQHVICPPPETDTFRRLHSVSDRKHHVEVVVLDVTLDGAIALLLNCRKFCSSWKVGKLFTAGVRDMPVDGREIATEKD